MTRPEVLAAVKKGLRSPLTLNQLKTAVTVGIDTNSFLVTIDASSRDAGQAAAIANAFATEDSRLTTDAARSSFAAQAAQLEKKLKKLTSAKDPNRAIYIDRLSTLQSLAAVAQPVQVSQTAHHPLFPDVAQAGAQRCRGAASSACSWASRWPTGGPRSIAACGAPLTSSSS